MVLQQFAACCKSSGIVNKLAYTFRAILVEVTGFSHFTMVNAILVCRVSNGGEIKAKFTIVKPP